MSCGQFLAAWAVVCDAEPPYFERERLRTPVELQPRALARHARPPHLPLIQVRLQRPFGRVVAEPLVEWTAAVQLEH